MLLNRQAFVSGAVVFAFVLCCCFVAAEGNDFTLFKIEEATTRDAVCSDGSAAGYYFRPGSGSGQQVWHFHLMGGFWCWDAESCAERQKRAPYLISLAGYKEQWSGPVGIFAQNETTNPLFHNVNHVYVLYCSSDAWSGDASKTQSNIFHFRGKKIVKAVLEDVYKYRGLRESSDQRQILFSGCSAGGVGVVVNANFVQATLRDLLKNNATRVLSLADAGIMFDYPLYPEHLPLDHVFDTTIIPALEQFTKGFPLWNGQLDSSCTAAYPKQPEKCYFGQYAYSFIDTPMLVNQQQYDAWQLDWNIGYVPAQYNSSMETYANNYRLNTVEVLAVMTKKQHTIFSGMCFSHCSTDNNNWANLRLSDDTDTSLAAVFGPWWEAQGTAAPQFYFDHCGSFNCSIGCPAPEF
ncbi:uncharacterized protein ACA1_029380 [Acanthamoeba castellanii str. Neff]|uniref:Pectinacetylesterase n=1 Tax=Acanthamoeba castellanii (strain ATCC 30010 / Neff) TaxID=1257118 RepID=L8H0A7_ACACF|nr:uncharacterized protein ACA1_029380 [Acanthamoeba castellanii str. Neff]ELR17816.1 hypothetical protein ACA1_029380 [Acanthamoeba castellanii str. Neff]